MSDEDIRAMFALWYRFCIAHRGKDIEKDIRNMETDANRILQAYNSPLSYAIMNAVMEYFERGGA